MVFILLNFTFEFIDMKIMKFGGTSVGSAARMKEVAKLIRQDEPVFLVLSAMSGTTNALVGISEALHASDKVSAGRQIDHLEGYYYSVTEELFETPEGLKNGKQMVQAHFDYIRTFLEDVFTIHEEKAILAEGELLSTTLFHMYLNEAGVASILLPALNFMRITADEEPDMELIESALKREMAKHPDQKLFITQGFVCRNAFGEIDNLKRGGSDYTATLIGAVLGADEVQIWTDIDGMHNNDPRIVEGTSPVAELSFNEAAELAYFGAKILHPSSILPAREKNIPVRLLNTMEPKAAGTIICNSSPKDCIKAVAAKDNITAIRIRSGRMLLAYGFLRAVFEVFERYKTPIDMITTSEVAVSLTIDNVDHLEDIIRDLSRFGAVEVDQDLSIICVVGDFLNEKPGYAMKIFDSLEEIPLRMISFGGSKNNISLLIYSSHKHKALSALHQGLFVKQSTQ